MCSWKRLNSSVLTTVEEILELTAHGRKVLWHGEDKAVRPMQVGEMILRQALDETRYFEGTPGLLLRSSAVQDASYAADLTSACAMALTALQL